MKLTVKLSEQSIEFWHDLLRAQGYGASDRPVYGISKFLQACTEHNLKFKDARPQHLLDLDEQAALFKLAKVWHLQTAPRFFDIQLSAEVPPYIFDISRQFEIHPLNRQRILAQGLNVTRPHAYYPKTASQVFTAVLTAIGESLLIPVGPWPSRPEPRRSRRDTMAVI